MTAVRVQRKQARDDFPNAVKEALAKRVGFRCSNLGCGQPTSGPQVDSGKAINVGVAAHITAASPGGPRFNPSQTRRQRRSIENGIWICQTCAKLIDNDPIRYSRELLENWKRTAEAAALRALENPLSNLSESSDAYRKVERLMPELLAEMRNDLAESPLSREFVILERSWTYLDRGNLLVYYFDDHAELTNKLRILQNACMVGNITRNNVDRYVMSERLVEYLANGMPANQGMHTAAQESGDG